MLSPRTKHNWHFTIEFLINTAPLNVLFILHYHLFFRKETYFSNVYILVNTIFKYSYLYFGWEIGHPLTTYANGGNEGEFIQMCTGAYRGRRVEKSVIRFIYTKWMTPSKCCGIFFVQWLGQVHWSITASKENVVAFFSIIVKIILPYALIRI